MIICSCNVISDRDVHGASKPCGAPAERPAEVFRGLGRAPKCGKCVQNIRAALDSRCCGDENARESGLEACCA